MDSEVYKFNKTFEERFNEYSSILADAEMDPSTVKIQTLWSDYLEMSIEPWGWNAIWNVSRKCCQELNIPFPTVVVVMVDQIDFTALTANVTITEVEDNDESNDLPTKVNDIPLKQLFVTITQEFKGPNYDITAECLDQYRLFYNHLWWPWDEECESNKENWVASHFLFRLRMYYDLLQGNLCYVAEKLIRNLIEQGKDLYFKIEDLQNELEGIDNDQEMIHDKRMVDMIGYLNELDSIKSQLSRWENTDLRKILNVEIYKSHSKPGSLIVIEECSMLEASKYFKQAVQCSSDSDTFKRVTRNLHEALLHYAASDSILISPGVHSVKGIIPFTFNLKIGGLFNTGTLVTDVKAHWCLFETVSDEIYFRNFEINVLQSRYAIIVKRGVTVLHTVSIKNAGRNSICGIIIHKGATLVVQKCKFADFNVSILCTKGASLQLIDSEFENNDVCVQFEKGANILLENCDFSKTKKIPIQIKGGEIHNRIESLEYLSCVEGVDFKVVKVPDSQKVVQLL